MKVPNPAHRPVDLTYFYFCSVDSATVPVIAVDNRAPEESLSLAFLLRLLKGFSSSTLSSFNPTTTSSQSSSAHDTVQTSGGYQLQARECFRRYLL